MAEDRIRYDILAQDALRGVMRKVLAEVARTGLPGDHHFFITFMTDAPGVRISSRLRERYPEQMTIVLQYQYWDLKVSETRFEVGLSFADVPEMLSVPFSAVRGFYDPSVNFEMEFDPEKNIPSSEENQRTETAEPETQASKAQEKETGSKTRKLPQKAEPDADEKDEGDGKGAEVVSLDAFRKK